MIEQLLKSRLALTSLSMSLVCLALTIEARLEWGPSYRPGDEGWQAHIFQVLIALQAPCLLAFLIVSMRSMRNGWLVLGVLAALIGVDMATVHLFHF